MKRLSIRLVFGLILISMFFLPNQEVVRADDVAHQAAIQIKNQIRTIWENHLTRVEASRRWQEKSLENGVNLKYIAVTKVDIAITFDETKTKADVIGDVIITCFGYSTETSQKVRYVEVVRIDYRFRKNGDSWNETAALGVPLPGEVKEDWPSVDGYIVTI